MKTQPSILRTAQRLIGLACLVAITSSAPLFAQVDPSLSEIRTELAGPMTLVLKKGNQQTGRITEFNETTIRIEVSLGGGAAELSFPVDEVREIAFPGGQYLSTLYTWMQDPARSEDAMTLFRAYYQQRGPYFSLMSERELALFISYAEFALAEKKPLRAVAMIDALTPYIQDPAVLDRLEESLLLGFFQGGMREQAAEKAHAWIKKANPAGASALGWRLLAELNYENEDFETAFWTAMNPIAFSNQMPMAHLDVCYAFAILSAEELRLKAEPARLAKEMRDRGLAWPDEIDILKGKAPEAFTIIAQAEAEAEADLVEEPIQTPSPVDPIEELPTRINF
jgi:hypothetical protein